MARYKNLRCLLRCPATSFPSSPSTSMDALNRRPPGETVADSGQLCSVCLQRCEKYRRCSICKLVAYCGTECQRADWEEHEPFCTYDSSAAALRERKIINLQHNIIDVDEICFVLSKLANHLLALHVTPAKADNKHALNLVWDLRPARNGKKMLCLLRANIREIPPNDPYYQTPTSRERRPRALAEMQAMLVEGGHAQWVGVIPVFSHPNIQKRHNAMIAAGETEIYCPSYVDILNFSSTEANRLRALAQMEMLYGFPEESYVQALVRQVNEIIAADTEDRHGWRTKRRRRA